MTSQGQSWEVQGYAAGLNFVATLMLLLGVISLKSPRILHMQRELTSQLFPGRCRKEAGGVTLVLHWELVAYKRSCFALPCFALFCCSWRHLTRPAGITPCLHHSSCRRPMPPVSGRGCYAEWQYKHICLALLVFLLVAPSNTPSWYDTLSAALSAPFLMLELLAEKAKLLWTPRTKKVSLIFSWSKYWRYFLLPSVLTPPKGKQIFRNTSWGSRDTKKIWPTHRGKCKRCYWYGI